MTYYPDGTPFLLGAPGAVGDDHRALSIGWLDAQYPFPQGRMPADVLNKLAWSCVNAKVSQTRGFHVCDLCPPVEPKSVGPHFLVLGDREYLLGSAEIRVTSATSRYAAPTLILHYVVDHMYLPPSDFIDGLAMLPAENALTDWVLRRRVYS